MSAFSSTFLVLVAILIVSNVFDLLTRKVKENHDVGLTTVQLVSRHGYPIEVHEVVTEDGYILSLHRIPHGRSRDQNDNRSTPVLLMPGILQTSAVYVTLGPTKALGYLLADRGFDVWLGNVRGTTWSRQHKTLDPDRDASYWNFSIDEMGYHDLSTSIDYILETTGRNSLHYIGYSQGTSIFFVLCSEKPEYADKVSLMSALVPCIYIGYVERWTWHLRYVLEKVIQKFSNLFGVYELCSLESMHSAYMTYVCDENSMFVNLCIYTLNVFRGHSDEQLNKTLLAVIFSNAPAGMSSKQFVHWMQISRSDQLQKFDHGIEQNVKIYGQEQPPKYNISRVTTPVGVYYSKGDHVIFLQNIKKTMKVLPNVVKTHMIQLNEFNHNDFVHGKDADKLLYNYVVDEHVKYIVET